MSNAKKLAVFLKVPMEHSGFGSTSPKRKDTKNLILLGLFEVILSSPKL